MDFLRCENMRADITSRTCLLNQARDELEGGRFHCADCEVGRVVWEANGGKLPNIRRKRGGGYEVMREDNVAELVKIGGEKIFTAGGQPLTVSTPQAAAKVVEAVASKVQRYCKNHPDSEAKPGSNLCLDCYREYQREWNRKNRPSTKRKHKVKEKDVSVKSDSPQPTLTNKPVTPQSVVEHSKVEQSATPCNTPQRSAALGKQIAGSHYLDMPIQVVEYCHKNGIGYMEGCVIKYVSRWRKKGGIEDLEKAIHYLEILIELELP